MKIVKKNETYFLNFENNSEKKELDLFVNKFLDIKNKSNSSFVLSLKDIKSIDKKVIEKSPNKDLVKNKIAKLLNDKNLTFQDKVEGNFEKLLNKNDLVIFKEMIEDKEIELFKLSSKYKKGVYQLSLHKSNLSTEDYSLFKSNKYIILKKTDDARRFSKEFKEIIKSGEVIGIKSFDGNYYVIYKTIFDEIKQKLYLLNLNSAFSIDFLESRLSYSKELLKFVIEILKDEVKIIEKRKESYEFI